MLAPGSRLERIGAGSFYNTKIDRMVIPKGVAEIREWTFSWCRNLKEVVLEEGSRLKTVGDYAFFQCNDLSKINLPGGVTSIGNAALSGCLSLRNILLPDGLESIGAKCFACSGLEEIVFPASVKEIGPALFSCCWKLKSVQLNEGLQRLGEKEVVDGRECEGGVF